MNYRAIASTVLAGLFTACTASAPLTPGTSGLRALPALPQIEPAARVSWIAPDVRTAKERLVYVADTYASEIVIYKQHGHNQQAVGKISTGLTFPVALWVDTHRNLWVANSISELKSSILRFPQGSTTPDLVLNDPDWNVTWVSVAPDGSVYAVNCGYYPDCEIVVYAPGARSSKAIGDRRLASLTTAVVGNANGDLFASGFTSSTVGEIDERPAHAKHWRNTGISLAEPAGLGFDKAGNLVASDIGYDLIETFPPGATKPSNTITCSAQCVSFAFDMAGKRIWIDEFNDSNGTIEERTYPGGATIDALPQPQDSSPQSVAVTPDLSP